MLQKCVANFVSVTMYLYIEEFTGDIFLNINRYENEWERHDAFRLFITLDFLSDVAARSLSSL